MDIYSTHLKYYVYAYLRECDKTPYYIGKGCGRRAYKPHKKIPVPKNKNLIVFLEKGLTEIGSYALERRYIRWYGKKINNTGILLNISDGGDGCDMTIFKDDSFKESEYYKKLSTTNSSIMKEQWKDPNSVFNKKERNEKISETLKIKWKDPNSEYNRDNKKEKRIDLLNKKWGKSYIIYSPEGVEYKIKGLKRFCRENNLNAQSLNKTIKGIQKNHKGWTIKELKDE
jgi:hypothetical protein